MEIIVGREVSGELDIKVPNEYNSVSRKHAKFYVKDNGIYVDDLSTNGTFINDQRIKTKRITAEDAIFLGVDESPYKVDVNKVIDTLMQGQTNNKTDYSKEFAELKSVYTTYQKDLDKVTKQIQMKNILPRIILTILVIVVILSIKFKDPSVRIVLSMGAGALGMAASLFGNKTSKSQEKKEAVIIKHNRKYVCPKCQSKLNIHRNSWNMLYERGRCFNNKCDAKFK